MAAYMATRATDGASQPGDDRQHDRVGIVVIGLLWSSVISTSACRLAQPCSGWSAARPAWSLSRLSEIEKPVLTADEVLLQVRAAGVVRASY